MAGKAMVTKAAAARMAAEYVIADREAKGRLPEAIVEARSALFAEIATTVIGTVVTITPKRLATLLRSGKAGTPANARSDAEALRRAMLVNPATAPLYPGVIIVGNPDDGVTFTVVGI